MKRVINLGDYKAVVLTAPWALDQIRDAASSRTDDVREAFARIPLIFRSVRLRCNTLRRVPIHVKLNGKDVEEYPFEDALPLKDLVWLTEAALLLAGHSASVILNNEFGFDVGLQWLNPFTVAVKERLADNGRWVRLFSQQIDNRRFPIGREYWTQDEMYYLKEFSILSDTAAGIAPAQVALADGQVTHYVTTFLGQFFKSGAMPTTIITVPDETKQGEKERIQDFFKRAIAGVKNVMRILAVNKSIEFKQITPDIKSFDVKTLDTHSIEAVADAFDIPTSLLRAQAKTKAIADAERESFINDTIWARSELHQEALNKMLAPYGYELDFAIEEMPEMQENEEERSASVVQYVNAGFSLAAACGILGVDVPEEFEGELSMSAERKQEEHKRRMLNKDAPPNPTKPTNGKQKPNNEPTGEPDDVEQFKSDMARYERKALSRLNEGKSPDVQFTSENIPTGVMLHVGKLLSGATSAAQVKNIFRATVQYVS